MPPSIPYQNEAKTRGNKESKMSNDPFVYELVNQTSYAKEVARLAESADSNELIRFVLAADTPQETLLDGLDKINGQDNDVVVLVAHRFASGLFAYYGEAAQKLQTSQVVAWLNIRLSVHRRFPSEAAFWEHACTIALDELSCEDVAVMKSSELFAYYGRPAATLSRQEVRDHVKRLSCFR